MHLLFGVLHAFDGQSGTVEVFGTLGPPKHGLHALPDTSRTLTEAAKLLFLIFFLNVEFQLTHRCYRPNKPKNGGITAGISRAAPGRDAVTGNVNSADSGAEVSSEPSQAYSVQPNHFSSFFPPVSSAHQDFVSPRLAQPFVHSPSPAPSNPFSRSSSDFLLPWSYVDCPFPISHCLASTLSSAFCQQVPPM